MAETCLHGETDRHYYSDQPGQPLALCGGGQCDHFNTMTASGQPLNPLRCTMRQGHGGNHSGGGTTWSESLGQRGTETDESPLQMALRMHDVQFARANRIEDELKSLRARISALCDEVLGHGADSLEGEMWRLRTIIDRIDALVSTPRGGLGG